MDTQKLAQLLFGSITTTVEQLEQRYPPRPLPEGAKVTRIAPSPTGFIHLGNLYGAKAASGRSRRVSHSKSAKVWAACR